MLSIVFPTCLSFFYLSILAFIFPRCFPYFFLSSFSPFVCCQLLSSSPHLSLSFSFMCLRLLPSHASLLPVSHLQFLSLQLSPHFILQSLSSPVVSLLLPSSVSVLNLFPSFFSQDLPSLPIRFSFSSALFPHFQFLYIPLPSCLFHIIPLHVFHLTEFFLFFPVSQFPLTFLSTFISSSFLPFFFLSSFSPISSFSKSIVLKLFWSRL